MLCRLIGRNSEALPLQSYRAPSVVVPHFCGASLLACRKKDGGLRPIAVGEVLRRLISKCISRAVQSESFRVLTPLQVGVGVQTGCESIVHALARVQEDSDILPEDRWTLLVDFSNAFNCINREHMFQEVRRRIPSVSLDGDVLWSSTLTPIWGAIHPQLLWGSTGRFPWSTWFLPGPSSPGREDPYTGARPRDQLEKSTKRVHLSSGGMSLSS